MTQRVVNYTYGTGNPVLPDGSIDVRDGIDNLQSFDIFMNADEDTYNQRDGDVVSTVSGANRRFDAQILNMGFTRIGTFAAGATLTNARQTMLWDIADGGDGQEYGWSGVFPKIVPATSTPASTGGISVGAWISRFDPELRIQVREALRRSYAELGLVLVSGSFEAGGVISSSSDVLLQELSGKAYSGPTGTVSPGTDPTSGGFVDRSQSIIMAAKAGTVSDLSLGKFSIGSIVTVTDRANAKFKVVSGGTANGFNIVNAGFGRTAVLTESTHDIRFYGGIDDFNGVTGTNNKPVIDYLISLRPITIKLSKTITGVYFYSGAASASNVNYTGVELDIDPGVSIHNEGAANGPFWRKGVKVNRELKSRVGGARYDLYSSPEQYLRPSEQMSRLTSGDGVISSPKLIDFSSNDIKCYQLSSWPAGTLTPISPVSATTADLDLGTLPAMSFKMAGVPVVPGDFIQAHVVATTVRPCFFIQTETGWVVCQQVPNGTFDIQVQFSGGEANAFTIKDELFKQLSYRLPRAAMGIIIYGSNSFGICVNGVVIKRINTPAGIIRAGWGAGFDTGNLTINRPSAIYRKKSIGIKPLKIVVVGDSTSAETLPPTQSHYMKQYLSGSCGAQVWDLKNLAVGGQTSAQQLAILQATDISGFDYCLIQVGVNDVQGAVAPLTYLANVLAMVDYANANSVTPIVGLPTQWYAQTDAQLYGQDGQATGNSFLAPSYRNVLMHGLAARGGVLMNASVLEDTGAVLAQLLSKPEMDPVVQDNIHPSAYGQMAMGMSYAKAIIGHLTGHMSEDLGVRMPADWFTGVVGAGGATPTMFFDDCRIAMNGYLIVNGTTFTNGMVIGNIPVRLRPLKTIVTTCIGTTADSNVLMSTPVGQIVFHEDGRIMLHNITASTYYLSVNASWTIR